MNKQELESKVALLESVNDQILTELEYVDSLMKSIGFKYGLNSLKAVASEVIREGVREEENCEN